MGTLFELLGSIGTLFFSFTKDVTEEEIEKNIKFLKEYQWFQNYLNLRIYQADIIYLIFNKEVFFYALLSISTVV